MTNHLQWEDNRLLENHLNRQCLADLEKHCTNEQRNRGDKITLIALAAIAIGLAIFCALASNLVVATLLSVGVFLIAAQILSPTNEFPGDPHSEVRDILKTEIYRQTHADRDFLRFADERGLLTPKTILAAHQLFKEHKMLNLKTITTQLHAGLNI